jgi:hypothetical protein
LVSQLQGTKKEQELDWGSGSSGRVAGKHKAPSSTSSTAKNKKKYYMAFRQILIFKYNNNQKLAPISV